MTEYIYIVKCPGCEDEMFSFFTDARMQCDLMMSKHPIITQVEVERNDFGECTDSHDLGTVWSWEEAMKDTEGGYTDAEPTKSIFTKDDLKDYISDNDPEFDNIDNSLDPEVEEPVISEVSATERKPIPEGMTIEQLVEEMEENEDEVECTLCNDLFDKSVCRKELNLGWLCRRCADDLVARGEGPVFKEDNYWDFLDEDVSAKKKTWVCFLNGQEVGTVEAATEEEAYLEMEKTWYINNEDAQVVPEDEVTDYSYAPDKYFEFEFTHADTNFGELRVVFSKSYADILDALKEIVDDDYVRKLSEDDEPQTEAEWKAAGKWDEFFTVDIITHIYNLTDELIEYFEEDREAAIAEAVKEAEEDDDGADPDGFYGWDDYYKWKNGDYTKW